LSLLPRAGDKRKILPRSSEPGEKRKIKCLCSPEPETKKEFCPALQSEGKREMMDDCFFDLLGDFSPEWAHLSQKTGINTRCKIHLYSIALL
jgi:hypothetical protein